MTHTDDPRHRYHKARERLENAVDVGDVADQNAKAIFELLDALDAENPIDVFQSNGSTETKSNNTLASYAQRLRMTAEGLDGSLFDQDTDSLNQFMSDLAMGNHEIAPEDGYANNTLGNYQSALKAFYRYHSEHDVDPGEIPVTAGDPTPIDARDMFTVEEVESMRDVIRSPRERCLFELLSYTGQRIRAIQTLRLKDVDTQEGVFWLNDEADGLKGASGKRPLLGAREYVYQWLEYHPTNQPEDYLLTALPKNGGGGKPGKMLSQRTIQYHLKKIANEAGVEKGVNPHIFRHYFTTIAKRDYGMDDAHIKRLRGDAPGSNVMETTYRHLTDEDTIEHAQAKHEGREPETESPLTPKVCPTCQSNLEPNAKACKRCGSVFTPDAQTVKERLETDLRDHYSEAAHEGDEAVLEGLDDAAELLEDPEVRAALVELAGELDT